LYQDQTESTVFNNVYNSSKIIGIHSYADGILAALNNGALVSIHKD